MTVRSIGWMNSIPSSCRLYCVIFLLAATTIQSSNAFMIIRQPLKRSNMHTVSITDMISTLPNPDPNPNPNQVTSHKALLLYAKSKESQHDVTKIHLNNNNNNNINNNNNHWLAIIASLLMIVSVSLVSWVPSVAIAAANVAVAAEADDMDSTVTTTTVVDITKGSKLFQSNCAGCHANGMNFVSEKKTLKKDALEKYRKTTDVIPLQEFVQKGMPHRFMPFSNEFSDADYTNVVSYVLDQALNDKW